MQGARRDSCVVCAQGNAAAKYRCPRCRARYCSVACCKKHKGSSWTVEDILTEEEEGDQVPLQKLQLLRESEELKGILLNPHLRQQLLTVDQAEDKSSLLRKYMQEPLFVEFADCCLRVLEPPEEEEVDLQGETALRNE
ncbi:zinc finger HIT domain-containing protein 3 [Hemicordylus capensis]|uniref:zinc finger HIT domain-containing protein 3 n=1 Tax=Hemicordylus capensis TaxID=884348 RepID=UPI002302D0F2|nr:zinc finger HIT domain-containing protein 3 [Hemicordylus capensis]